MNLLKTLRSRREVGVLIAFFGLCIFFSVVTNTFLTVPNILNILRQVSISGLIVMFMTMLIIGNDIDLSVGSTFAAVSMVVAILFQNGLNIWLASLIGLLMGAVLGGINGFVTVKGGLPPFIVTLGTQMIYRGLALVISGGAPASVRLPNSFYNVTGARTFFNLPVPALWFLGITALAAFLLHKTSFGFKVYATGGNEEAARLSGINTGRVRIITFILVGMSAALAGIIQMAYLRGVTPTAGQGMELTAIASSVIGGTSMFGGVGTIAGSFIGTLFMGVVRNGLVLMGTNAYIIDLIIGIVLIGAVWFSTFSTREKR
ncbi:MAG: ABC transporter permease [Firmicutes bacterium]|nr:ABC transporter permease [Bacillota bacterium]